MKFASATVAERVDGATVICIYCAQDGKSSKEHVWPQWLGNYPATQRLRDLSGNLPPWEGSRLVVGAEGTYALDSVTRGRVPLLPDLTVKDICVQCNTGWMSQLESNVKPLLDSMIDGLNFAFTRAEQDLLALWATKTALNYARALQSTDRPFTDAAYAQLFETRHPEGALIWVGRSRSPYAQVGLAVNPHWILPSATDSSGFADALPTAASVYIAAHGVVFIAHFLSTEMIDVHEENLADNERFVDGLVQIRPTLPDARWPQRFLDHADLLWKADHMNSVLRAVRLPLVGLTPDEAATIHERFMTGDDLDEIWDTYPQAEAPVDDHESSQAAERSALGIRIVAAVLSEEGIYRELRESLTLGLTTPPNGTIPIDVDLSRESGARAVQQEIARLEEAIQDEFQVEAPAIWHVLIMSMARELIDSDLSTVQQVDVITRGLLSRELAYVYGWNEFAVSCGS